MDRRIAYEELARRSRERALLASCSALLGWDEQTYLPRGGASYRGDQMALLAGLHHERATDPALVDLLDAAADGPGDLDPAEAADVREWRRDRDRAARLPRALVEELARVTTIAQGEWVEARSASDLGRFRPWLESIVALKRQESACLSGPGADPYDALLDEYEPGARAVDLAGLFDRLRGELVPLVAEAVGSTRPRPAAIAGDFPIDRQRAFGTAVAAAIGFDFERGRLDVAAHPFCSGIGPGDCRITTRYDPTDFTDGFFSILHEVGHGLYDQGLDPARHGRPTGEAASLGVHESQSRLWENAVGRSRAFWARFLPDARAAFGPAGLLDDPDAFHASINRVEPTLIRVQADEVTYNLHVLVRFGLERALIGGDLAPADLPGAWDDAYRDALGVVPPDAASGCLQDVHWSAGLFGYFPTYTLGNLYAAQLVEKADADLGGLAGPIARGDFAPLLGWLRETIHRPGRLHPPTDLVRRAIGGPIDAAPLIRSLRGKVAEVYAA